LQKVAHWFSLSALQNAVAGRGVTTAAFDKQIAHKRKTVCAIHPSACFFMVRYPRMPGWIALLMARSALTGGTRRLERHDNWRSAVCKQSRRPGQKPELC